ncbi:unnamed protein product [Closterium sp. NIES-64]|nr:unnamed protein product [Closterium sp. NIES-64]
MPCHAAHEPRVCTTSHCLLLLAPKSLPSFQQPHCLHSAYFPSRHAQCTPSMPPLSPLRHAFISRVLSSTRPPPCQRGQVENGKAQAANFPFCTIEPNVGVVAVPDPRLGVLSDLTSSKRTLPATVEFVDIAGLVKGASQGEGLGNKFLSHIREVDSVVQVVRCFEDSDIVHVSGAVNPTADIDVINLELALSDLSQAHREAHGAAEQESLQGPAGSLPGQTMPLPSAPHRLPPPSAPAVCPPPSAPRRLPPAVCPPPSAPRRLPPAVCPPPSAPHSPPPTLRPPLSALHSPPPTLRPPLSALHSPPSTSAFRLFSCTFPSALLRLPSALRPPPALHYCFFTPAFPPRSSVPYSMLSFAPHTSFHTPIAPLLPSLTPPQEEAEAGALERIREAVLAGGAARSVELSEEEAPLVAQLCLLTAKPIIYAANVAETDLADPSSNPHVTAVEAELCELGEADRVEYLQSLGVQQGGLAGLVQATYRLLGLRTYFTAGEKETRAWTIRAGMTAPQAAGVIHTDFERGFIRAETISYKDFVASGSYTAAKEKGLLRAEGKEYVVQEGDVMLFRFNV